MRRTLLASVGTDGVASATPAAAGAGLLALGSGDTVRVWRLDGCGCIAVVCRAGDPSLGGEGGIARRLRTANGTQNLNVRMFFRNVSSQDGCYFHSHRTQIFWTCNIISAELTAEIVGRRWVRTLASRNLLTLTYLRKYFGQQEKLTARLRTVGWPPRQVLLNLFRQPTKHVTFTNTVVVFRWRSGSNFSTSPRKCQPRVMMRAEVMPIKVEASIPNVQRQ